MSEINAPPTIGDDPQLSDPNSSSLENSEEEPSSPLSFDDFDLSPPIRQALVEVGYERPMEVQAAVFAPVRAGRDIQVESHTGSGKTAAFGLPILEKLIGAERGVEALILAPTRELAKQVADELTRLAVHSDVDVAAVYGGAAMGPQVSALERGVKIVAGTPGRVLDHIRRRNLVTNNIKTLVLDECDEMLSMGFAEEIENIVSTLPAKEERQTLLFSATIPDDIVGIANRHLRDPVKISLSRDGISASEIEHHYYLVNGMARTRDLLKLVLRENPKSAIIFCNTRDDTAVVARYLARNGFDAEAISGDLSQRERERVMKRMRDRNLRFLVATDIAARGIDISDLSHVINYQFPESAEVYVHRTGRTGRAGKTGIAISLVGPREIGSFYYLKLIYKIRPEERDLPPTEELAVMLENHQLERVTKLVTEKPNDKFVSLAQRVWDSEEGQRIVGALLERLLVAQTSVERDRAEKREQNRDDEPRRRSRARRGERGERGERERGGRSERGRSGSERGERSGSERGGRRSERERHDDDDREPRRRRRRRRGPEESSQGSEDHELKAADDTVDAKKDVSANDAEDVRNTVDAKNVDVNDVEDNNQDVVDASADVEKRADRDDDGKPKRKRRRRRKRGGRSDSKEQSSPEASPPDESGREFWETWADEKTSADDGDDSTTDGVAASPVPPDNHPPDNQEDDINTRLYVNIGKREDATADDIRSLIGGFIGGDDGADQIASIALRNTHSYVRVPDELVDTIIDAAEGQAFGEREILIEKARR